MKKLLIALLAVLATASAALAQERGAYSQAELDQMLAPIALYPDALLSQVLMASTYPLDIVEAARWARANPGLQGDEAVAAVAEEDWDPSVKSLVAFPTLLARMDEKLDWTKDLGDAFLVQETQVMAAVQQLRQRARAAGQLAPDERVRVVEDGGTIVIEPADPQVVYVPCYDPWVVYGSWWWSAYPPVAWAPCPGYYAYRPGFWWGVGIGVSTNFFFGGVDWHHRHVTVVHVNNFFVRPHKGRHRIHRRPLHVGKWQHDRWHRRGIERRRVERRGEHRTQPMPPAFRASNPQPRMQARPERRIERARPQPRVEVQRPQPRMAAPRAAQPRMAVQRPQPRRESRPQIRVEAVRPQPRVEAQRPQPRMAAPRAAQPRMAVQRSQPRTESRPQMRGAARGAGNGGGRGGGWRGAGNGGGRGGGWR
jgi:hypothetical protein